MGKILETRIDNFAGGMVPDARDPRTNVCQVMQHFDPFVYPSTMVPYRGFESGDESSNPKYAIIYNKGLMYALGNNGNPGIFQRNDSLSTGGTWGNVTGLSAGGSLAGTTFNFTRDVAAFSLYHDVFYGVHNGQYVWAANPTSGSVDGLAAGAYDINGGAGGGVDLTSYATTSNFLIHSKDDILYLGYDNKIAKKNGSSWTVAALTLPSKYIITSLCEYGNYLAIACRPKDRGRSKVFLWDRDSSVTTLSESIDAGEGELMMLEELQGYLIAVMFEYVSASGFTLDNSEMIQTRVSFKYYQGSQGFILFKEFRGNSQSPAIGYPIALSKQKHNDRLYFGAVIPIVTTGRAGVWSIAHSSNGFAVTMEYAAPSNRNFNSFFLFGNFCFICNIDGTVSKTSYTNTYGTTAIYESKIYNASDSSLTKKLIGATLTFNALPSGASALMAYRVDGATSWTTIFSESTAGAISHSAINIESTGVTLPEYKEIEFRIESVGATIQFFSFMEEAYAKNRYMALFEALLEYGKALIR